MYRKNVAGQFVCVQLLLTATGAVATGLSPAARRCIDGTFAAGGGTFTEDGTTGSYKYALAQADTNGNNISIIATATGAIPVCVNFVTTAADPTDATRLGLTALPNAAAGAANGLPLAVDNSGRVDTLKINGTSQTAGDIFALATTIATYIDTEVAAIPTANQNAAAILDLADGIETGVPLRKAIRAILATTGGKMSGGGTTTNTFRNAVADSKDRVAATVDVNGNRTAITYDLT